MAAKEKKAAAAPKKATKAKTDAKATKAAPGKVKYATVKKTDAYVVMKKRSGRFAVKLANHQFAKADEKVKILMKEGLIKAPAKKKEEAKGE